MARWMVSGTAVSGGTSRSSSASTSRWYSRRFMSYQDFSGRNGSGCILPSLRMSISTRVSASSSVLRQVSERFIPRSNSSSARSSGRSPASSCLTTCSSSSRHVSKDSTGLATSSFSAMECILTGDQRGTGPYQPHCAGSRDNVKSMPPPNPFQDPLRFERRVPECAMVIFGASGDLTKRKLMPALYRLAYDRRLSAGFAVVGISRTPLTDEQFREKMREAVEEFSED